MANTHDKFKKKTLSDRIFKNTKKDCSDKVYEWSELKSSLLVKKIIKNQSIPNFFNTTSQPKSEFDIQKAMFKLRF